MLMDKERDKERGKGKSPPPVFHVDLLRGKARGKKKRPPFFSGKKPKSVSRTSRKLRNPSAFKCDWWTKISSLPSSGMINPNPLLALNHLTVFYFILESQERDRDRREKEDDVSDRSDFSSSSVTNREKGKKRTKKGIRDDAKCANKDRCEIDFNVPTPVFFDIASFVLSKRTRRFVIGVLEGTKVTHDDIRARLIE